MTPGFSIFLIRDPPRGTSQLYLRVAWTSAFKQFFLSEDIYIFYVVTFYRHTPPPPPRVSIKYGWVTGDTSVEQPQASSKELVPRIRGMILEKTVLVEIKYIRFQTETVVYVNEKFSEQLKTNMTIILSNQEIQKEDKTKFLGIIIDQHLTWKSHIDYIVPKISKMIGTLRTIRFFVNQPLLKVLYNSFICPYLHYGNIGWGTTILQD